MLEFWVCGKTHSAMDLIASVLSDSKYYLESLYNKASQELSNKRSDKGEKLTELFDLLFEYVKDNKFERLKEPSAYDPTCKKLYPEQNASGKMQRVVLIGYTYDKKQPITLSWIWDHKMGTFIEKCFGFYQVRQVREELEARISELEDENENLAVKISELENSNDQLWQAREKLKTEKTELLREKDNLTKANAELKRENDKLNHQIIALTKEQDSLKYERVQLQDAHGSLKELCTNSEKDNQRLADKLKKLESTQKNLANSNNQLLQTKEKIAKEKTEMERKMARLKGLEATDKSELDLQNRRFKSAIEDLKRQKQKIRRREYSTQREG